MSGKKIVSVRQIELLIDFMENHIDLAHGRVRSKEGRVLAQRLWQKCADILNAEDVGNTFRSPKEWNKFYNDYKCRLKNKARKITCSQSQTGGGPNDIKPLTPLEERLCALLGPDKFESLPVQHNPVTFETNPNDIIVEEIHQLDEIYMDDIQSTEGPSHSLNLNIECCLDESREENTENVKEKNKKNINKNKKRSIKYHKETALEKANSDLLLCEKEKIALKRERLEIEKQKVTALVELANAVKTIANEITKESPQKKKYKKRILLDIDSETSSESS